MPDRRPPKEYAMRNTVAITQGCYFFITGIWPLFSIGTFQMVTGRKTDLWLVKTVGLVLAVIGATLFMAGARAEVTLSTALLAVGSAAGLAGIDIVYAGKKVISSVYLLDAVLEAALIIWWGVVLLLQPQSAIF